MNANDMEIWLPNLASLYQRGVLVPFLGSGMSRETCTGWETFLKQLAVALEDTTVVERLSGSSTTGGRTDLYRIADELTHKMLGLEPVRRIELLRWALRNANVDAAIPSNMTALVEGLNWPLVLTTNYDDLYWEACRLRKAPEGKGYLTPFDKQEPRIVGRGRADCHLVLRSLDRITPPLLWALQGYLGGQCNKSVEAIRDPKRREELADQVVVGHQQYQQAIHGDTHFRRAFAEVFRRRSLLFLGSGILEDYLVNLFSEIIYNHGPSAYPHFALLPRKDLDEGRVDERFLTKRLGITPVFWNKPEDIGELLSKLSASVALQFDKRTGLAFGASGELSRSITLAGIPVRVTVSFRTAPLPLANSEALLFSAGRDDQNLPRLGHFGTTYLTRAGLPIKDSAWSPLEAKANAKAFHYQGTSLFAIAARKPNHEPSYRDLGVIAEAVDTGLRAVAATPVTKAYLTAIASGRSAHNLWHPIHPFAQTLRGVRQFLKSGNYGKLEEIEVCVVDRRIWENIVLEKVSLSDILVADQFPFLVELQRRDGQVELFHVMAKDGDTIESILKTCQLDKEQWHIDLRPRPSDSKQSTPSDQAITPTMSLVLKPNRAQVDIGIA